MRNKKWGYEAAFLLWAWQNWEGKLGNFAGWLARVLTWFYKASISVQSVWCHQKTDIPPPRWHLTSLPLVSSRLKHTWIFKCSLSLTLSLSLVHPLSYVGHSVYIDRYFQCLGPQEISLGNFQRTDRPTFLPLNWNGQFPSLLVWHLHTKWHCDALKWTQISCTAYLRVQKGFLHTFRTTNPPWRGRYTWIKANNAWKLWPSGQLSTHVIILQNQSVHVGSVRHIKHNRRDPGELKQGRMTSLVLLTFWCNHPLCY